MRQVSVDIAGSGYKVALGRGILGRLGKVEAVAGHLRKRRVLAVSDRTVHSLYGTVFEQGLRSAEAELVGWQILEPGEEHKTLGSLSALWDAMVAAELERRDCLVVLGGGVVGDVGGLAAATYQRGVDFLQFPTTVLAMADSSVGGKTAIDHPRGKNLIGAFHQPRGVAADLDTLDTLPRREMLSGFAEVIKAGLIGDSELFGLLETRGPAIVGDTDALEEALARAVEVKARIVEADEREGGPRALLNLGHTLGHAVEVAAGYGAITHGEAVALGLSFVVRLSEKKRLLERGKMERILSLLVRWGYPLGLRGLSVDRIVGGLRHDKKCIGGDPRWVLLRDVGAAEWGHVVDPDILEPLLREVQEDP